MIRNQTGLPTALPSLNQGKDQAYGKTVWKVALVAIGILTLAVGIMAASKLLMPYSAITVGPLGGVEILLSIAYGCIYSACKNKARLKEPSSARPQRIQAAAANPVRLAEKPVFSMKKAAEKVQKQQWETCSTVFFDFCEEPKREVKPMPLDTQLLTIPQVGVYQYEETEGLEMASMNVAIRLPREKLSAFPQEICQKLQSCREVELFVTITNDSTLEKTPERQLFFHPYVYENERSNTNKEKSLSVGLFQPNCVKPASPTEKDGWRRLPFDKFDNRKVQIHPAGGRSTAFSPRNAFFYTEYQLNVSSFFGAGIEGKNERGVAFYTILVHSADDSELGTQLELACNQEKFNQFLEIVKPLFNDPNLTRLFTDVSA